MSVWVPICSIPTRVHDHDAVGDGERLGLVVGHVDGRLAGPALQVEDGVLERVAQVLVERGQRLVEQQHGRDRWPGRAPAPPAAAGHRRAAPAGVSRSPPARPSSASRRRARGWRAFFQCLTESPKATLSATDMWGNRAGVWNTKPMLRALGGSHVTSLSSKRIWPAVGSMSPAVMRRVVVLPHPDGPSRVTNSPSATSRSKSSTATVWP